MISQHVDPRAAVCRLQDTADDGNKTRHDANAQLPHAAGLHGSPLLNPMRCYPIESPSWKQCFETMREAVGLLAALSSISE
ncbi:MAG TPA: hypothetical protein DEF45_06315 [Rhodopirellula sp.]|nr:hypothetical protein [Rhodopirellula sp.]